MSRIGDRDHVVLPDPESLPGQIVDRRSKYTHAYPEGFRMDRGSVKIFGPQQAPRRQTVAVLDKTAHAERIYVDARIAQDDTITLPNGQQRSASHVKNYTHAYPENFAMRLTSEVGSDVKIIGPRKAKAPQPATVIAKATDDERERELAALRQWARDEIGPLLFGEVAERSWADEETEDDEAQRVFVNQRR